MQSLFTLVIIPIKLTLLHLEGLNPASSASPPELDSSRISANSSLCSTSSYLPWKATFSRANLKELLLSYVCASVSLSLTVLSVYALGRLSRSSECEWFLLGVGWEYMALTAGRLWFGLGVSSPGSSLLVGFFLKAVWFVAAFLFPEPLFSLPSALLSSLFLTVFQKKVLLLLLLPLLLAVIDVRLYSRTEKADGLCLRNFKFKEEPLDSFINRGVERALQNISRNDEDSQSLLSQSN